MLVLVVKTRMLLVREGCKTLVETPFIYLEVAVLKMLVQIFAQIKVQKSGLCHEYKVRNLIENGLQCVCVTHALYSM